MIVVLAVVDAMIIIVVVIIIVIVVVVVVVVGTNNGVGFFAKFKVSANVGKIRVMLNREESGRYLVTIWVVKGRTIVIGSHMSFIGWRNGTKKVVIFNTVRRFGR
jgi:hypothetical protein